jgi:hypothetical protein
MALATRLATVEIGSFAATDDTASTMAAAAVSSVTRQTMPPMSGSSRWLLAHRSAKRSVPEVVTNVIRSGPMITSG